MPTATLNPHLAALAVPLSKQMKPADSRERICDALADTLRARLPGNEIDVSVGVSDPQPVYEVTISDPNMDDAK